MAKINLRAYNHEIETLIDQNQFDQAIAHTRHILKIFPKHIQTYRLLGKAYLENQRYGDASDIFQRVLSAIPDDFVSHVGMSIIREDESNLDESIWHMERAFEVQPANNAIQGELRRLYGRRDGLEPPKVRLTRGALARMYLKGELYAQAISELRAAMAEDPERQDLQSLLAQAFFLSGQKVEAANACNNILKKMPYSLEANRILSSILAGSERSAEAESYRQKMQVLDPYLAQTSPAAPIAERVSDSAVLIEKLVYVPGQSAAGTATQPDWAASLGVKINQVESDKDKFPDWLLGRSDAQASPADEPFSLESGTPDQPGMDTSSDQPEADITPEAAIPEWMKAAGWKPAASEAEELPNQLAMEDFPALSEEAAPGDIPDWLMGIAPPGELLEEPGDTEAVTAARLDEVPADWGDEDSGAPENELPEWLAGVTAEPSTASELPNWLQEPETTAALPETGIEADDLGTSALADLPDWLDELKPPTTPDIEPAELAEPADEIVSSQTGPLTASQSSADDDAAFAWLESLAAKQGAQEALFTTPDERSETPPTWVVEAVAREESTLSPVGPPDMAEIVNIQEMPATESPKQDAFSAEIPDWLQDLGAAGGSAAMGAAMIEPAPAEPEPQSDLPDWLRTTASDEWLPIPPADVEPPVAEAPTSQTAAAPEAWLFEDKPAAQIPEIEAANIPDWLKDLAEETPTVAQPQSFIPLEQADTEGAAQPAQVPDWLKDLGTSAAYEDEPLTFESTPALAEAQGSGAPPDLPAWLKNLDEEVSTPEPEFAMLFGPQVLAATPIEKITSTEPLPVKDDTQPTRIRPAQPPAIVEANLQALPVEMPALAAETGPEAPADELPDWLRGITEQAPPAEFDIAADQTTSETAQTGWSQAEIEAEALPAEPTQELPDWLRDLAEVSPQAASADLAGEPIISQESEFESIETENLQTEYPAEPAHELPDWLRDLAEPDLSAEEVLTSPEAEEFEPLGEVTAGILPTAETPSDASGTAFTTLSDEDAAFAWLEGLAAKQGASEALILNSEDRLETPPDWVVQAAQEAEQATTREDAAPLPTPAFEFSAEELPDMTEAAEAPVSLFEPPAPAEQPAEPEAIATGLETAWLFVDEETSVTQPGSEPVAEPAEIIPDLPSWLADVEEPEEPEESQGWQPPAAQEERQVTEIPAAEPVYPVLDINQAGLVELERLPGIGYIRANAILEYRQTSGPISDLQELLNIQGIDAATLDELSGRIAVFKAEAEPAQVDEGDNQMLLIQARNALIQGEREKAILQYQKIIKTRQMLPDVIRDLNEALYRYPVDFSFWQTLGDAYMRAGSLQDALDAYTKAEELLR